MASDFLLDVVEKLVPKVGEGEAVTGCSAATTTATGVVYSVLAPSLPVH